MRREKRLSIRLDRAQYQIFQETAKEEGFISVSDWARVTLQRRSNRGGGRPGASPEQKEKNKLEKEFKRDELIAFSEEQGKLCPGSGELWVEDKALSGFKFPFAICGVCHRSQFGLKGEAGIFIRKHKDGIQLDGEI